MARTKPKARKGKAVWLSEEAVKMLEKRQKPRESYGQTLVRILKGRK
jgi:hypothetical protein